MPVIPLASFPNSRVKAANPTVTADSFTLLLPASGSELPAPPQLVLPANLNRSYTKIQEDPAQSVGWYYFYAGTLAVDPSVTAVFGIKYDLLWNPDTSLLYQKQDDGLNTNWTIVEPNTVAFSIETANPPVQQTLQSLQDIYAFSAGSFSAFTYINVDFGSA